MTTPLQAVLPGTVVNVSGKIFAGPVAHQAQVSVFDRSFLYGDSLYEVFRTYAKNPFLLDEHLARLQQSAKLCHMELHNSIDRLRSEIEKTLHAFWKLPGRSQHDVYCRIIITRGAGRIGFAQACVEGGPQWVILVQDLDYFPTPDFEKGVRLQISSRLRNDRRALDPAMKSGNYLNSLLAYLEASDVGLDDALLLNFEGHVTEGTTFNVFYARKGVVATPPVDIGILEGITRRHVLGLCHGAGIEAREVRFPKERLFEADEVFITSSLKEAYPVTQIDQVTIGNGRPGPITRKLKALYHRGKS